MSPQDSFIDEEDDVCPLCIEEFDLSDKNFRPCPCGYQVCQFCFNNIKNNMNGLCPACRRPYDEKTIEWKVVTTEEVAEFRANITKNQKKRAQEQRQKEVQKREAEKENRKNLIGVRVVQKNLVYITGLAPNVREDELLKTLRKPEFFGQYGTIQKISISNRKSPDGQHHSLGIYVTFETPDEAMRCIQAVHGSHNGDRLLKAQHGTTKYCSAWLKNEKCNNPGCMFLHEQGDEEDSYTRQDLSSMNSIHTQRPLQGGGSSSSRTVSRQQMYPALPSTSNAAASAPTPPVQPQLMARSSSKDGSDAGTDASALPSSANWARLPQRSRRGSHATSGAASSPAVSMSTPATTEAQLSNNKHPEPTAKQQHKDAEPERVAKQPLPPAAAASVVAAAPTPAVPAAAAPQQVSIVNSLLNILGACSLPSVANLGVDLGPAMFDIEGGEKRKALREDEVSRIDGEQSEHLNLQDMSDGEIEAGGSLALGGEPDDRDRTSDDQSYDQRHISMQRGIVDGIFGGNLGGAGGAGGFGQNSSIPTGRSMTPQQAMSMRPPSGFGDQGPPGIGIQSGLFAGQTHQRQSSRFNFAGENGSSITNIKVATNPRLLAQQSSMMSGSFSSQQNGQFYAGSMPGPPPGLKSTGTPPNLLGQGFGGPGYNNIPKDSSNELLQSLIGRSRAGNSQTPDVGKRESMISSLSTQYPTSTSSTPAPASGLLASLYGNPPGAFQDFGSKQKKKGKKHRHANTSSSGGSGLVDLADPSILQARMPHQAQGNAGAGQQGLFGGQNQDDDELPSLEEAISSVDALVSDDTPLPTQNSLLFMAHQGLQASDLQSHHLSITNNQSQLQQPSSSTLSEVVSRPPPGFAQRPSFNSETPSSPIHNRDSQSAQQPAAPTLLEEDFPALGTPDTNKTRHVSVTIPVLPIAKLAKSNEKATSTTSTTKGSLGTPVSLPDKEPAKTTTRSNSMPIPPATPSQKQTPKTLRVMPVVKPEPPATISPATPIATRTIASAQRPDTPASEMISDSASVVSASMTTSRPGSPLQNKGRAPTKSHQRKQRRELLKQETQLISEAAIKSEVEEHAPVLGRKKKQKKEKPQKEKQVVTRNTSSSSTPPAAVEKREEKVKPIKVEEKEKEKEQRPKKQEEPAVPKAKPAPAPVPTPAPILVKEQVVVTQQPIIAATTPKPEVVIPSSPVVEQAPTKLPLGPVSVFAEIRDSLWTSTVDKLQLFKTVSGTFPRSDTSNNNANAGGPGHCKEANCKCGEIQPDDLAALRSGNAVRKQFHVDGSRMLITPNGDCVRGLTPKEEEEFLQLQAAIAETAEHPGAFVAPRHQSGNGAFSLIKGRAVPNGRPNIFPASAQLQSQDPIGKLQREDALSYINQYVLPRLNLGAVGAAKNAPSSPRDTAAASLNSLAPYFYGPDAAAGVGIYSSSDGTRPIHDFAAPGHGDDIVKGPPGGVGNMPLMAVDEAETALVAAKKETEKLEKSLNAVIKRNRRLLVSGGN